MIVKFGKAGRSFKGLGTYLTLDPKAKTAERVAWTHSLNTASDHPSSVISEMYLTYMHSDALKQEAGDRASGLITKPVRHVSVNWAPGETPSREHMVESVESLLKKLGWSEHQALLVAHTDKPHLHVHVMVNACHPETGRTLNSGNDWHKASEWRIQYEKDNDRIFTSQERGADNGPTPTRESWLQLKEAQENFEASERRRYRPDYMDRETNTTRIHDNEWKILKEHQRKEREAWFADGKEAFKELKKDIYEYVRSEFTSDWKEYYRLKRSGTMSKEELAKDRSDTLKLQNYCLTWRLEDYTEDLRELRDEHYNLLLTRQREERQELRDNQERGVSSHDLLNRVNREPEIERPYLPGFQKDLAEDNQFERNAKNVTTDWDHPHLDKDHLYPEPPAPGGTPAENPRPRDPVDAVSGLGLGALGALAAIGERLFDGFFGGGPKVPANTDRPSPA